MSADAADPNFPDPTGGYPDRRPTDDPRRFLIPAEQLPPGFAERVERGDFTPVEPRPAATVVLVRDAADGPEALLLRRHNRSGFAADAWVFPGGLVDEADRDPALPVLCDGPTPAEWAQTLGVEMPADAFGYVAAALREAFEETGILLARRRVTQENPGQQPETGLGGFRDALLAGELTLRGLAVQAGVQYAADELTYLAHWITPEPEPRRYDTRFFLAPVSATAEYTLHAPELVEARWLTPAAAVAGFRAGELKMLPPTVHTLQELAAFPNVVRMRLALRNRAVPAILPRMQRRPDGVLIDFDDDAGAPEPHRPDSP